MTYNNQHRIQKQGNKNKHKRTHNKHINCHLPITFFLKKFHNREVHKINSHERNREGIHIPSSEKRGTTIILMMMAMVLVI